MLHRMTVGILPRLHRLALHSLVAAALSVSTAQAECNFDVDGDGHYDALTDGVLAARVLQGYTGSALTQGALGPEATRTLPGDIIAFVNANKSHLDLDGNGILDPATDGLLFQRYLLGLTGDALAANAVATNAQRADGAAINGHLVVGCNPASPLLKDAARLLTQATFGPKYTEIYALAGSPPPQIDNWITNQFSLPRTNHVDFINARDLLGDVSRTDMYESFWSQALGAPDQLRQRVAFALSQIIVVSDDSDALVNLPWAIAGYYDVLAKNAFGNYRTLLEDITKNPAMAIFLSHLCNDRETATRLPNENYAREVLQLFSIGTAWLNADGTIMLDAQNQNQPIPTYDQNVIQGFAKVFTGWAYNTSWNCYPATTPPWYNPLVANNNHHSYSSKTLLSLTPNGQNVVLPATTSALANAQADLTAALDNIFNHPNVGPYIGKQLIKFLVTSNPTPEYVARVAAKFANNGNGVRGDMQAVIRAILTDSEARDPAVAAGDNYGKLREPAIRFGNLMRTFNASASSGRYNLAGLGDPMYGINQQPLSSPTVFNFFGFDYAPQGPVSQAGLVGPEFEITTSTAIVQTANNMKDAIRSGWGSGADAVKIDYLSLAGLAATPSLLVDYLNLVMANGAMTATTAAQLTNLVGLIPQSGTSWQADRWKAAIYVLFNSPEYVIQR